MREGEDRKLGLRSCYKGMNLTESSQFNSTANGYNVDVWLPNVALATIICAMFAFSLVCYLSWLAKTSNTESGDLQRSRSRSRSSSSDSAGAPSFQLNPLFPASFKKVLMSHGSFTPVSSRDEFAATRAASLRL